MSNMRSVGALNETEKRCEWKIPYFYSLCEADFQYYDSSSFKFMNLSFHLAIQTPASNRDFISVYLMYDSGPPSDITYSFSLKKYDGTLIGTKTVTKPYVFEHYVANGITVFFNESDLWKHERELLPEETLTIICDLKSGFAGKQTLPPVKEDINLKETAAIEAVGQIRLTDLDTLSENFKNLFLNKESCDTTLHVMEKEYKAHRAVLIARSSVFAAMFLHETSEKQTGIVNIPDCDPETFEKFLEFLYSGKFEKPSLRSALHLYQTSDKYNVQKLKTFCSGFLMENLTVEYFCDVVIMADKYDDTKLFSAVQCFFNNNLSNVFSTTEWKDLLIKNHRLANTLLMEMSSKVKVVQ